MKFILALVLVFIVLNVADILTTVHILGKGGVELNPLVTVTPLTILLKMGVVLGFSMVAIITYHLAEKEKCVKAKVLIWCLLMAVVMFYGFVVINNLQVMAKISH